MQIKDFDLLFMDDKFFMVNNAVSKLIESHPWYGRYKTNLHELDGIKVNVLVNTNDNHIMLAHALEDSQLESLTDSIYLN